MKEPHADIEMHHQAMQIAGDNGAVFRFQPCNEPPAFTECGFDRRRFDPTEFARRRETTADMAARLRKQVYRFRLQVGHGILFGSAARRLINWRTAARRDASAII